MEIVVVMVLIYVVSRFLTKNIVEMLCNAGEPECRALNYRGKAIPAIGGIVFAPIMLIAVLLLLFLSPLRLLEYLKYLLIVYCMGFTGIVDDLAGNKEIKGLTRHWSSTLGGHMTTGFLKALSGFLIACAVSIGTPADLRELPVNVLIIALSANTINLFDLRPGRAIKVFILYSLLLLSAAIADIKAAAPLMALVLAVLAYGRYDLKEICMLGDTGANILGISLGYYSTLLLGFETRLILAVVLVGINLMAERVSISELIGRSRLLSYIDALGREDGGGR
ncbi:MAG TPA: hypothetical protein VN580_03395 [Clostridia bacterium]|nr:hypothetical protein [Clostridia bacterium]